MYRTYVSLFCEKTFSKKFPYVFISSSFFALLNRKLDIFSFHSCFFSNYVVGLTRKNSLCGSKFYVYEVSMFWYVVQKYYVPLVYSLFMITELEISKETKKKGRVITPSQTHKHHGLEIRWKKDLSLCTSVEQKGSSEN